MGFSGRPKGETSPITRPVSRRATTPSRAKGPDAAGSFAPLPVASRRELWLWLLHRRRRLEVKGYSMWPALQPGDELLLDLGAYRHAAPRIGDVVMARHPYRDEFILKRVTQIAADGRLCLRGDNVAHSTDSRVWGFFAASAVRGRVTCRFLRAASRPKRRRLRVSERKGAP